MQFLSLLSDQPTLRLLQVLLLVAAGISVFLVLFTTRDAILRSESFWFQLLSIVLVAALPVVGFLLYLLIRPSKTLWQRDIESMLRSLTKEVRSSGKIKKEPQEKPERGRDAKVPPVTDGQAA